MGGGSNAVALIGSDDVNVPARELALEDYISNTAIALIGFMAWTFALLVLWEAIRTYLVITLKVPASVFAPDNANLSPSVSRAHTRIISRVYLCSVVYWLSQ
jgi:hypothetical protein